MGYFERNWIQEFDIGEVLLYRRYVDDIFACLQRRSMLSTFFKYLNSKDPNNEFTKEKKTSKHLLFLDVFVKNEGKKNTTSVYRKKKTIALFTQYK